MPEFYDRAGERITRDHWVELSADDCYRTVIQEQVGVAYVSTVWLGIDHSARLSGPIEIFESMVFGGERDQHCARYATEAQARTGHAQIVASVGGLINTLEDGGKPVAAHNPEDRVLDAIDQLVNEQLEVGPLDDYNADRYVKCTRCGNDWHGLELYGCPASDLEGPIRDIELCKPTGYVDQVEGAVVHDGRGWTLSDIATLRSRRWGGAGRYAYREHFAPACPHTDLDLHRGELPTCHECGEPVELRATDVLEDDQIAEILDSRPIRFWQANLVSGELELEEIPGASITVGGREPLWLRNLVEQTIRSVYGQLAAVTGIDLNGLTVNMQTWLAEFEEVGEIEAPALNPGNVPIQPAWVAQEGGWALPSEEPLTPGDLEGPF